MTKQLHLDILPQPDEMTCGPTCLHAVYRYFDDEQPLPAVIRETQALAEGGTLAVLLGCHALSRGYQATIYTYNLAVFDPTWFVKQVEHRSRDSDTAPTDPTAVELIPRLQAQMKAKSSSKLQIASKAYIHFLERGGQIRMRELNAALIRRFLKRSVPILTGLSSTYLYQCERELEDGSSDDIRGKPTGHFVVLCGYDPKERSVRVADPYLPNPLGEEHFYEVGLDRLVCAILLGVLTHDANLLIIEPGPRSDRGSPKSSII
ncbi:MAG: hypothetical protein KDA60_14160 [Planctomycetales bacterium]|nr:hypothetical protein [Planctomycetales bacterium]